MKRIDDINITLKKLKESDLQWIYAMLFSSSIYFVPLRTMLIAIGNYIHIGLGSIFSKISLLFFGCIFLLPILKKKEKFTRDMLVIFSLLMFSWLLGIWENLDYLSEDINIGVSIFVKAFPYYCIARKIKDWDQTKDILYHFAIVTTIFIGIAVFFELLDDTLYADGYIYNQFYGIIICPAAVVSLIAFWEKKETSHLINLGISCLLMYIFGARSPFLCLALAFVILTMKTFFYAVRYKRIAKFYIVLICLCLIVISSGLIIILNLEDTIDTLKVQEGQRFLYLLQRGMLLNSDSRIQIYKNTLNLIGQYPILGVGLIKDRVLLAEVAGVIHDFSGYYAHNIFLEFILQYGIFIGGFLNSILMYLIYICLFKEKNSARGWISVFGVSYGIGLLLVSSSAFEHEEFWLFVGIAVGILIENSQYRKNINTI